MGQLAAKVRAQYPGVYDDLDDAALEAKVVAKYPEYQDLAAPPAAAPPAKPAPSMMETLMSLGPTIGGAVGGIAGGVPGAAIGGAAGVGYRDLAKHGAELPGAAMDVLRNLIDQPGATLKGAAEGMGQGLKDSGIEGGLQALYELGGNVVTKGVKSGARAVYRGYLKPSLAEKAVAKANPIVETAISEALPITRSGAAKAQGIIGELRAEVDRLVAAAPGQIDLQQIADKVRAFAKRKYYRPGADPADYNAALAVADRLDSHPALQQTIAQKLTQAPVPVSVAEANSAKRAVQSSASSSYGVPNAGATKQAGKAAGHELRVAVENATGGASGQVAQLNARESRLIDAARAIAKAAEREANHSKLYGVKTAAAGSYGGYSYAQGDDPLTAIGKGALARAMLTPGAQSRIAIVADRIAATLGVGAASAARLATYVISEQGDE